MYKTIKEIEEQREKDLLTPSFTEIKKGKHTHTYDTDYNNRVYICECGAKKKMI